MMQQGTDKRTWNDVNNKAQAKSFSRLVKDIDNQISSNKLAVIL